MTFFWKLKEIFLNFNLNFLKIRSKFVHSIFKIPLNFFSWFTGNFPNVFEFFLPFSRTLFKILTCSNFFKFPLFEIFVLFAANYLEIFLNFFAFSLKISSEFAIFLIIFSRNFLKICWKLGSKFSKNFLKIGQKFSWNWFNISILFPWIIGNKFSPS